MPAEHCPSFSSSPVTRRLLETALSCYLPRCSPACSYHRKRSTDRTQPCSSSLACPPGLGTTRPTSPGAKRWRRTSPAYARSTRTLCTERWGAIATEHVRCNRRMYVTVGTQPSVDRVSPSLTISVTAAVSLPLDRPETFFCSSEITKQWHAAFVLPKKLLPETISSKYRFLLSLVDTR